MKETTQDDRSIFWQETTKLSKSPYLSSPLEGGQNRMISKSWLYSFIRQNSPILKSEGVCNGLCLDYARHVINHKNTKRKDNYISKLKRKLTILGKDSENFVKRINMYQRDLQSSIEERITIDNHSQIFGNGSFDEFLNKTLSTSSVIGLSFQGKKSGHIIAIQKIKNEKEEITGYKIFDPNVGEFDCTGLENATSNTAKFNKIMKEIYETYGNIDLTDCSVVDLEKKVRNYELVKPTDLSLYKSEHKYLDTNPKTPKIPRGKLYTAAEKGELEEVKWLLKDKRTDMNETNDNGASALYIAAQNGHNKIVKLLLTNPNIDPNQANHNGVTPLFIAAQKGHVKIVKMLIEDKRTKINIPRADGCSAITVAEQQGFKGIVNILKSAIIRDNLMQSLKTKSSDSILLEKIKNLDHPLLKELASQIKTRIEELSIENKGWSIKRIISSFPEETRMKYFFNSARKSILVCAKNRMSKKIELILSAFPKQSDRDLILASALLTPLTPMAKPALIYHGIKNYSNLAKKNTTSSFER